jgi:hypothetical protein
VYVRRGVYLVVCLSNTQRHIGGLLRAAHVQTLYRRVTLPLFSMVAQKRGVDEGGLQAGGKEGTHGNGDRTSGAHLLQDLQERSRSSTGYRDRGANAGNRQIVRLLSGDDLCRLPRGSALDNGNPDILLNSISRYYKFLSREQQQISSNPCARRRHGTDSPQSRSLTARPSAVRKSATADTASRRLEMSILWNDVES